LPVSEDDFLREIASGIPLHTASQGFIPRVLRKAGLGVHAEVSTATVFGLRQRVNRMRAGPAVQDLIKFGFIFTKHEKVAIYRTGGPTKWMGHQMTREGRAKARGTFEDLAGGFNKPFHWERKATLNSLPFTNESRLSLALGYVYERIFGPEFYFGESLNHPDNLGLSRSSAPHEGWLRDWKVAKLERPKLRWTGGLEYNNPYATGVKASEARKFSIKRQKTWKKSRRYPTWARDYITPKIEMNDKRRPELSSIERATPRWAEIRLLLLHGECTGKLVSGLSVDEALLAPYRQRFARDPFEARATGGYSITTKDYAIVGPNEEEELVASVTNSCRDIAPGHLARRMDARILNPLKDWGNDQDPEVTSGIRAENPYFAALLRATINRPNTEVDSDHGVQIDEAEQISDGEDDLFFEMVKTAVPQYETEALLHYRPVSPRPEDDTIDFRDALQGIYEDHFAADDETYLGEER
jgi:hypothetical protein